MLLFSFFYFLFLFVCFILRELSCGGSILTYAFVFGVKEEWRVQDESVLALNGLRLNVKPATFAHISLAKGSCGLS